MSAKKFTQEQEIEIARLYKEGKTLVQIMSELGVECSKRTVSLCLQRQGVEPRQGGSPRKYRLEGTKTHHVEILAYIKHNDYRCRCECGREFVAKGCDLNKNKVKTCGCHMIRKDYSDSGEIQYHYIRNIWSRAIEKGLDFNLTGEYIWQLFLSQDRKCALTGLSLTPPTNTVTAFTASLDRIDSSNGYVIGNVQWVHKWINIMKWDLSQSEFINMCRLVANNAANSNIEDKSSTSIERLGLPAYALS